MSVYDMDKVKLKALEYAEKNKIVNQKTINAFIDGFRFRDAHDSDNVLSYLTKQFQRNYDSWENDCGYGDYRGEMYTQRKTEGYEALELAKEIDTLKQKIKEFNKKYRHSY